MVAGFLEVVWARFIGAKFTPNRLFYDLEYQ